VLGGAVGVFIYDRYQPRIPILPQDAAEKQDAKKEQKNAIPANGKLTSVLESLAEFKKADEEKRTRLSLAICGTLNHLNDDECASVIDEIRGMKSDGKALARVLCHCIANRSERVMKKALAALEDVHPKLYQPMVALTVGRSLGASEEEKAVAALQALGDPAIVPFLARQITDGIDSAKSGRRFHFYSTVYSSFMRTLVIVAPDEPASFALILQVVDAYAKSPTGPDAHKGARNFSINNVPVVRDGIILLGEFGPKADIAIPVLKELRLDREQLVRDAATQALSRIEAR
jgi:hypothetical protein